MTKKEEFFAYLRETSAVVDRWPDWKKSGLNTPVSLQTHRQVSSQEKPILLNANKQLVPQ